MKIKKLLVLFGIVLLICFGIILLVIHDREEAHINLVELNDITQILIKDWDTIDQDNLPGLDYGLDYVVLDHNNEFIAATKKGLNEDLTSAISNRDTIVDLVSNDEVIGKLIIYNNTSTLWQTYKMNITIFSLASITIFASLCFLYVIYINRIIIRPFDKLKRFSKLVAEGNLDLPLEMDKGNHFGAFTESFDLMREELKKARENERKANLSKKELIASLSHDIKTPVASIKAVSEIMHVKSKDENDRKQYEIINSKADQINMLITNMFHATLEELQELKVTPGEKSSILIYDLINDADYQQKVTIMNQAECIVVMDPLRLSQVIDNVISNSYKYAGTSIEVSFQTKGDYLEVSFQDYGIGVSKEELPLLFNKYYRAKNAEGKSGTGLGLYISKYLMKQMKGDIECENSSVGMIVRLKLLIA